MTSKPKERVWHKKSRKFISKSHLVPHKNYPAPSAEGPNDASADNRKKTFAKKFLADIKNAVKNSGEKT